MEELYKDNGRVESTDYYYDEAKIFWENIYNGNSLKNSLQLPEYLVPNEKALKELLHKTCNDKPGEGDKNNTPGNDKEKRICRCFYYRNKNSVNRTCKKRDCKINYWNKNYIINNCDILEYEIPPKYTTKGVGEFDLLFEYDGQKYAV